MSDSRNPKDAIGSTKLPLHLWPPSATAAGCLGLLDGMLKYGRNNFRATEVLASVYVAALKRHTDAFFEGESIDPDSGIPHLAGILANAAILVDAGAAGSLVDDRQFPGGYAKLVAELTPHVARLQQKHADKNPRHYTIADVAGGERRKVIRVAVGVLIDEKGRVFLQRRSLKDENFPGRWECPGGGIEKYESTFEALLRELREELGIALHSVAALPLWAGTIEGYGENMRHEFVFERVVKIFGEPKAIDGQPDIGWFQLDEVAEMALTPANLLAWPNIEAEVREIQRLRSNIRAVNKRAVRRKT